MNIEELRTYCLSIKGAEECMPFDESTLVFKVMSKMFAITSLEPTLEGYSVVLKCDPERAIDLRERYRSVTPGFHCNKVHWNSIQFDGDLPDSELKQLIRHSVDEVVKKLPKKLQQEYQKLGDV